MEKPPLSYYQTHVKSHLAKVLSALGLDVAYTRAEGDRLFYRGPGGREVPVLDLLGGYGSLIFGHNHPQLVHCAKRLLDQQVPVHAQFSLRERSGQLAAQLSEIIRRETRLEDELMAIFANSGAEAVEAAIKHAELSRMLKLQDLLGEVTCNIERVREALRRGTVRIPAEIYSDSPIRERIFDVRNFEELVVGLIQHNSEQLLQRPIFLALKHSFHGKLIGSVQLTYNKTFRRPFQYFGLNTRFVSAGDSEELRRVVAAEKREIYDLAVADGWVRLVPRELPVFSGFLVEPIQGEGGVHCLTPEAARAIRKTCNELDCPLIVDEIQSGLGRSGAFLASSLIPLRGDYYTLSKSLGGGIAKISVALIRRPLYRKEFGLIHSSTYAEDDFSSGVALKVLAMLEDDGGRAYQRVRELGGKLRGALDGVAQLYPDIIQEVRGQGLFLGVEFRPQHEATSVIFRGAAYNDTLGYLLSGYFLRTEGIRLAPTGSAPNVLRLEPSMYLTDAEVARVAAAFGRVCEILRNQDALHVAFPVTGSSGEIPRREIRDFRNVWGDTLGSADRHRNSAPPTRPVRKVAFINHLITPELLREVDPSLAELSAVDLRRLVFKMDPLKKTVPYPPVRIQSPAGSAVDFILYPLCVCSEQMSRYLADGDLDGIRSDIEERVRKASDDGCEIAGLGMYTSIVTNNGMSLKVPDMALTTGNSLTVAMAYEAIRTGMEAKGWRAGEITAVVVGAAGNIASTFASLLAESTSKIVLLGSERNGSLARLEQTASAIYADAWEEIQSSPREHLGALAHRLAEEPFVNEWIQSGKAPGANPGRIIAQKLRELHGADPYLTVTTDPAAIRMGQVVLCAANCPEPFLDGSEFGEGAVVCDIAVPNNVLPGLGARRPDLVYQQGGIVATPHGESLHPGARAFLGAGQLFACMAETAVLGLSGIRQHYSYGSISKRQVREIAALARLHGFTLSHAKVGSSL